MKKLFLCLLAILLFFFTPTSAIAQVIGGQGSSNGSSLGAWVGEPQDSYVPNLVSPSFNQLAPTTEAGFFTVPNSNQSLVKQQLGYDPSRAWAAGATPEALLKLGDLLNNRYFQGVGQLSLRDIAQQAGIELQSIGLNQIALIRELTLKEFYQLYPQLQTLPLGEIPFLADTLSSFVKNPQQLGSRVLDVATQGLLSELANNPALQGIPLEQLAQGNWQGVLNQALQQKIQQVVGQLPQSLSQLPVNEVFPLIDGAISGDWQSVVRRSLELGLNLDATQLFSQLPSLQDLPLGVLPINNLSINSLPGIVDLPLARLPNAAEAYLKKLPGLANIPINQLPINFALNALNGDIFARLDIAYAGQTETPIPNVLTGSTKDQKFKPEPCSQKRCPHFELDNAEGGSPPADLSGKAWVEGKAQLVPGGKGFLRSLNNGQEPTGIAVWGTEAHVKLSLEDIQEGGNGKPATARVWANFQFCLDTFFSGEQCSPHFIPVPTPWVVKEGGLMLVASSGEMPDFLRQERDRIQQQYEQQYGQTNEGGEYGSDVVGDGCADKVIAAVPSSFRGAARKSVPLILAEAKKGGLSTNQTAYVLATVQTESNMGLHMYEIGKGGGRHGIYYGRGYVQITWDYNYRYWSQRLGIDLIGNPDLAAQPEVAAKILIGGMKDGTFTGMSPQGTYLPGAAQKLSDYINSNKTDYVGARHIVNGQDKAGAIANDAKRYQQALQGCSSGGGIEGSGKCTGNFAQPTKGVLTSGYGPRNGRNHNGIDVANSVGTPMVAIDGGTIEKIYNGCATTGYYGSGCGTPGFQGYGNIVVLKLCNGWKILYAHAQKGSIPFKPGQKVDKGQLIAKMGSSGSSTGPHIHFEIRTNNGSTPENPLKYIPKY